MDGLFGAAAVLQVIGMSLKLGKELNRFTSNVKDGQENVKSIEAVGTPSIHEIPMTQSEKRDMLMSELMKEERLEAERLDKERKARETRFRKISRALKLVVSKNQSLHELLPLPDANQLNLN